MSSFNALDFFEDGLYKDKLKKLDLRKDAYIIVNIQQKYDLIAHKARKKLKKIKGPIYKLKTGENLFELSEIHLRNLRNLCEIKLTDTNDIYLYQLSHLPNLSKLIINYSLVNTHLPDNLYKNRFFCNLQILDLSYNNFYSNILSIVSNISSLRFLILTGNNINHEIPDISNLVNLEELNLSFNKIESFFINVETNSNIDEKINSEATKREENLIEGSITENFDTKDGLITDWKRLLKTNIADFFEKLSFLNNLKSLNVSHNKIHFFDIDPLNFQQYIGFPNLEFLDISYNYIEEEIGILLIMNLNKMKYIDLSENPITFNQIAYNNVEYELYKNKNINLKNKKDQIEKGYKIKNFKVPSIIAFQKMVKNKIIKDREEMKIIEKQINSNENAVIDILESDRLYTLKQTLTNPFNDKNIDDNIFITKPIYNNKLEYEGDKPYYEFLKFARICLGKEKHYKKENITSINQTYRLLRYTLNTLMTETYVSSIEPNYMKNK